MHRRAATLVAGSSFAVVLAAVGVVLPVPYVALVPGPVCNTLGVCEGLQVICVAGHASEQPTGELDLTTVQVVDHLQMGDVLRYWVDSDAAVLPRDAVFERGKSQKQVEADNTQQMVNSQNAAVVASLTQLGYKATRHTVVIDQIPAGSPAADKLRANDEILAVDGVQVTAVTQLIGRVRKHKVGETVQVRYRRRCEEGTVSIVATADTSSPPHPIVGVQARNEARFPVVVDIKIDNIGGPSAGLMFALGVIDKLTPGNLTKGNIVAGTGEIFADRKVGRIGGVREKMVAARNTAHARYFIAPKADADASKGNVPKGLTVIPVETLDEALKALAALPPA